MYFTFIYEATSGKAYALQCNRETQAEAQEWAEGLKKDYGPLRKMHFLGCISDIDPAGRHGMFDKAKTKAENIERKNLETPGPCVEMLPENAKPTP